ncbi:adenylylsulfate reductase beta-subunit [Fibrobacteria bacterium R8-3-H12]
MSIEIKQNLCVGCGRCAVVCPGSLIKLKNGIATMPKPERCWGCASCAKECTAEAIALFLGEDMGGLGGRMTVRKENSLLRWTVAKADGTAQTITVNSRDSNKY